MSVLTFDPIRSAMLLVHLMDWQKTVLGLSEVKKAHSQIPPSPAVPKKQIREYGCMSDNTLRVFVISPDTDVYHIGLPLQARLLQSKENVVQISAINSHDLRLLRLNNLLSALQNDPDLANINPRLLPQVLQTLYVTSGCDYISFFSSIGKATFLQYFVQHASFISGYQQHAKGIPADVSLHDGSFKLGFLAFLRLIGVIYFKKHATGFNTATPVAHYLQFLDPNSTCQQQQHTTWLDDIRQPMLCGGTGVGHAGL